MLPESVPPPRRVLGLLAGLAMVGVCTGALLPGRDSFTVATPALVLVAPGLVAGLVGGRLAADRSVIFEPFRTGSTGDRSSGVGLAICKAIVEAHGGHVSVGDAPGGGARFAFQPAHLDEPDHDVGGSPRWVAQLN